MESSEATRYEKIGKMSQTLEMAMTLEDAIQQHVQMVQRWSELKRMWKLRT